MSRRTLLGLLVGLVVCGRLSAQETKPEWKAGAAKVNITPEKRMWMSGYGSRDKPAEGKLTELWAKALVVEDPAGKRGVLVTMDLVGISRDLAQTVRQELKKKHGLRREQIILSVSHTHTGPVVPSNLDVMFTQAMELFGEKHKDQAATQRKYVNDYGHFLEQKLIEVVDAAIKKLAPAKLTWSIGRATFAVNRRTNKETDVPKLREIGQLKGPVDHDVPVLCVRDPSDRIKAIVFGYACHATVLSFFQWSGDYPGFSQMVLEKNHPDAVALFWAGCGGDQNPLPRRTVALAQRYGKQLADAVQAELDRPMTPIDGNLATSYREIDLPFAELPTREQLAQDAASKKPYVAVRGRLLLEKMKEHGSLRGNYPYPVQVWRLGNDVRWVTLGGEVVVDYALRIKKEIGPGKTWVMGYANDVMAYVPSLRVLKEGGYEGGGAMIYYGLPTVWGPQIEDRIMAAVHDSVRKSVAHSIRDKEK
jgi:hypothetical protein